MELFWKCAAGIIIAVILILAVGKQEKDLSLLLSMAVCVMVCASAFSFLKPVLDFLLQLEILGDLRSDTLKIMGKITGIGLITEIVELLCQDSGNTSLGKGMHLMGMAGMLYLAIPIFEQLLNMVQMILGEI